MNEWNETPAEPTLDPQNPFDNETEFTYYNTDYGDIVPQIRIPGCQIPLMPNKREKSRIRRYQNIVGGFLSGHFLLTNVLAVVLIQVFYGLTTLVDTAAAGGELPMNYDDMLMDYLTNSSSMMALNILAYGLLNVAVALLGCKATKIPIPNLFRTRNFTAGLAFCYITIALMLQTITGYAAMGLSELFEGVGISLYEADFSTDPSLKSAVIGAIYSVIVAPITEELLMRGFVLKNLSRFGQRFGIVMSAFLFGIWHENIAQFLLAFAAGCFFGYLTVKHDSLVPSILCHMAVNSFAEIFSICETFGWDFAGAMLNVVYMVFVFIGLVLFIRLLCVERFPKAMPAQTERGLRITMTSPLMLLVVICHIGAMVLLIVQESI